MSKIAKIHARQILDSRGNPTLEADVWLADGSLGRAAVPSGASTGKHEAVEKRDGKADFYSGKSVLMARDAIHGEISNALIGMDATHQPAVDKAMCDLDGSDNKARLGANAILAVSLAVARAAAAASKQEVWQYLGDSDTTLLPLPMMNVLNGGAHADNRLDFQECMLMPIGASSFSEAVRMGVEIFHTLKKQLAAAGLTIAVGDEGGFAPDIPDLATALDYLMGAIDAAGYSAGKDKDVVLAVDAAASEFYDAETNTYNLVGEARKLTTADMIGFWQDLATRYPIVSIEDGLAEDDWAGYTALTKALGDSMQLVGDDLFATNPKRLQHGIAQKAANAILVKPNQIGTLTETLQVIGLAQQHGFGTIISHRSGETEDSFIADLAVATGAGQIKTGSLSRSDRTAKYNQLLRIEESLGQKARYQGRVFAR